MSQPVTWSPDIDYDTVWFVVGQIANQISGRGLQLLQQHLVDEGLELTGELKKSLFREVRQNNTLWLTELALEFEDYGRFKDMKQLTYSKQAPVEAMQAFVEKVMAGKVKNVRPFKFVSGYKYGQFPRKRETAVRQLAWSLARSRLYQPIVLRKGKGWYIKNYMREIYGQIETNIQAAAAQAALNTMAQALKDR